MTIAELQKFGVKKLTGKVMQPEAEADMLLSFVLNKDRAYLYSHPEEKINATKSEKYKTLIKNRMKKIPFAYLVGKIEFYGLEFKIDENVLIPRPETELIVQEALRIMSEELRVKSVVDVGTGSGAILISIAANASHSKGQEIIFLGIDISSDALKVARQNAKKLLTPSVNIKFTKGYLLEPAKNTAHPRLVVANLPYLTPEEIKAEELKFEPQLALAGGEEGLELIEKLMQQFSSQYQKGDALLMEIGHKQAKKVKSLAAKLLPECKVEIKKDFSGYDRLIKIF